MLRLQKIAAGDTGGKVSPERLPLAGYMFEEAGFKAGLLVIPPQGEKRYELTSNPEVFYVLEAEPNSLEFTLHKSTFCLSKGCVFTAPAANLYHLKNASLTKHIVLHFVLVYGRKKS